MQKYLCFLYSPFKFVIIIVVAPVLTVAYWLLSTAAIPLYIFRKILAFNAQLLDPDLCQMVNTLGHIISRDYDDWNKSVSHAITVLFTVNGSPTISDMRQLFLQKLVHKKDVNYDKLEYPELQQMFTKRLGYLFFKWDRSFDICNHVNVFSTKELLPTVSNAESNMVNEGILMKIWETVSTKPLCQNRSPWDVHVIPNYFPNETGLQSGTFINQAQTVVILRVHHGLSDGFGIYKLLLSLTDDGLTNLKNEIPAFGKAPACMDLFVHLKAFFCGTASLIRKFSVGLDIYNPLHLPLRRKTGQTHILTATIDLEIIKNVTRVHPGISFHSVLLAAISGGFRNFIIENGQNITVWPIRVGLPIPKPGHTYKLRNDFFCTFVDLPVCNNTPKQRLFSIEKRLNKVKKESLMPFLAQTSNIVGLLPLNVVRFLTLKSAVTAIYSEMKGPSNLLPFLSGKRKCLDLKFCFGLGTDDLDIGFTSLTYNGKVSLVLSIDYAVAATRRKAQDFMNLILKELEELRFGDSTNL